MLVTRQNRVVEEGVRERAVRYGRWGATAGGILCVLPLISYVLGGDMAFNELHTSLPKVITLYIVGSCIVGVLVGIVVPLIKSAAVAGVVGSLIGIAGASAIQIMDSPGDFWTGASIFTIVVEGIGVGGSLGVALYRRSSRTSERPSV